MHTLEVGIRELKAQPSRVISLANNDTDVIITNHGRPMARIVPITPETETTHQSGELFGIWKGRPDVEDVDTFVRGLRSGRQF